MALVLYQENLYEGFLGASAKLPEPNDAEVFLGSDFAIDLERLLDLLRPTSWRSPGKGACTRRSKIVSRPR